MFRGQTEAEMAQHRGGAGCAGHVSEWLVVRCVDFSSKPSKTQLGCPGCELDWSPKPGGAGREGPDILARTRAPDGCLPEGGQPGPGSSRGESEGSSLYFQAPGGRHLSL